jgi:hypothetical protein
MDDADGVAGVIDEHFLAGPVILPQYHIQMARPLLILIAKPRDMCCNTCQPLCGGRIYVAGPFESYDRRPDR